LIIDEVHILNLAVHPDYRSCGIAQTLLEQTLTQACQTGACSANLEVRHSNQAAIAVYRKFGFETVTVRRKYYENREDGLLMVCSLKNKNKHRKH
jgi:ribosomal-protein-alanine N-acetyltransferase